MEHLGHTIYLGGLEVQTIHFGYRSLAIQIFGGIKLPHKKVG
jgi:hypothetical protein